MFDRLKTRIEFKISAYKVKRAYRKQVKLELKYIKFCIHYMMKIGHPSDKSEITAMKKFLSLYDESISELNEFVEVFRKKVS